MEENENVNQPITEPTTESTEVPTPESTPAPEPEEDEEEKAASTQNMRHQQYQCVECEATDVVRYFLNEPTVPFFNCHSCHRRDTMQPVGEGELVAYGYTSRIVRAARGDMDQVQATV